MCSQYNLIWCWFLPYSRKSAFCDLTFGKERQDQRENWQRFLQWSGVGEAGYERRQAATTSWACRQRCQRQWSHFYHFQAVWKERLFLKVADTAAAWSLQGAVKFEIQGKAALHVNPWPWYYMKDLKLKRQCKICKWNLNSNTQLWKTYAYAPANKNCDTLIYLWLHKIQPGNTTCAIWKQKSTTIFTSGLLLLFPFNFWSFPVVSDRFWSFPDISGHFRPFLVSNFSPELCTWLVGYLWQVGSLSHWLKSG